MKEEITPKCIGKKYLCVDNSIVTIIGHLNGAWYLGSNRKKYLKNGFHIDGDLHLSKQLSKLELIFLPFILKLPAIKSILKTELIHKRFRSDLNLWEEKYTALRFINFYIYRIFINGKLKTKYRLMLLNGKTAKYIDGAKKLPKIIIGKSEFQQRYNSNKYIVPESYIIDLTAE